jgi:hypothetical protein
MARVRRFRRCGRVGAGGRKRLMSRHDGLIKLEELYKGIRTELRLK